MPRRERVMEIYKGDIFFVEKRYDTINSEQQAGRPAIIVSNNIGNEHSNNVEVVYLTTQDKTPLPTHVRVMCHVQSTALCETIYTISKERLGNYIRTCTDEEMAAIDEALMISLGIKREPQPSTEAEIDNLKLTIADRDDKIAGLGAVIKGLEGKLEDLQKSDTPKTLPYCIEDIMRIEVERDFYKTQYEALFERVIGKAVQS